MCHQGVAPADEENCVKGVMSRAHTDIVRSKVANIVERHQLGMMKGGYEAGVHAMRALANQCKEDGEAILIIDFANAFNACNRNLLVKLAVTFIPELAPFIFWLYAEETELFVSNGEEIKSSEGVHQGCGLSNLLFVLLMRYILRHVPNHSVSAKGSYLDEAFTKTKPSNVVEILKTLRALEAQTGLAIKISKCHIHAPSSEIARECKKILFTSIGKIKIHSNMNLTFLNTPIGTDDFVEEELGRKLELLKAKVTCISEMPFKMEAFTLLRTCWSQCRVVHLTRTLPPRQIMKFVK